MSFEDLRKFVARVSEEGKDSDELYTRKRLKRQFREMDRNGDGKLSPREFSRTFEKLGWEISRSLLNKVLDRLDSDGDGRISFAEFMEHLEGEDAYADADRLVTKLRDRILEKAQKCSLKRCFDDIDEDNDGKVSDDEFYDGIREYGCHFTSAERRRLWDRFDLSEDGYVSYREFHEMVTESWSEADYCAERRVKKAIRRLLKRYEEDGEVAEDLFEAIDVDGDGKVEMDEFGTTGKGPFARALYRAMSGLTEMQKRRIFTKIDTSGDGTIGATELRRYVERTATGK
eukprot:g541.t1